MPFGVSWSSIGKFAATTGLTVAGGALGSVIPGVGTAIGVAAGSALGGFIAETAWDATVEDKSWGESLNNGVETGALSLLGGGVGGAARGAFATLGGRNLARRMLDGAIHPGIRNPTAIARATWGRDVRTAFNGRGVSLNAARGWLTGAGVGAGFSGVSHSGGPGSAPGQGQSYPATLPTKPLNASTTFSTS
ncbi:hypothetical protein [Nocardia gamkensis]|uniref:Uncharacterized protein n=1 Tax=Nocardia gamkensis TaxID=352869 RepID=A0A7X6R6R8_9NOCA|nr:hypothetical protein [Nocardia gamkensis]NKY30671.1 hypothetical protein [Nocardia gamkensis]NQE71108.1 hypothetical protein [Nocardia gamkensis]